MSLERLKNDLEQMNITYVIVEVPSSDEQTYRLSDNSPANVGPDGRIFVMERLNEEEKIEAIAHELGHIFYRHSGQVSLDNYEDQHNLPLEINNTISHRSIIDLLMTRYEIASTAHISRRITLLEESEEYLINLEEALLKKEIDYIDYNYYLAMFGVYLLDIEKCLADRQDQVNSVVRTNPRLSFILDTARIHLFDVAENLPESEQRNRIENFLVALGFNIQDFSYCN